MRLRNKPWAVKLVNDHPESVLQNPDPEKKIDWTERFGNDHPIEIEVGSGKGHFITTLAEQNPDKNYVALGLQTTAAWIILRTKVEKGLDIVRECRERYDGRVRNPFNEIECGHWYARAMASYGMLQGLTGVRYDAVDKTMYINSKIGDFKSFISTDTGFGTIEWKAGKPVLNVVYGNIDVKRYNVSGKIVD